MENNIREMMQEVIRETRETRQLVDARLKLLEENVGNSIEKYEENYRPTHKNKIDINTYIKNTLGESYEQNEVDKVQTRALLMFNAKAWQDIPYDILTGHRGMAIIDDSISSVIKFRTTEQVSLFNSTSDTRLNRVKSIEPSDGGRAVSN